MSPKHENVSNSGYVRNIVLKTVKGLNKERTPFTILIPENSFKFGIVFLVLIKMLFFVLIIDFRDPKTVFQFVPISNTQERNGPSVSFGTYVP